MTIIFTKLTKQLSSDAVEELRRQVRDAEKRNPSSILMGLTGMGFDSDRVLVLLSEDYSTYSQYIGIIKQHPLISVEDIKSFIVDLTDENQFLFLTLSNLARYLEKKQTQERKN